MCFELQPLREIKLGPCREKGDVAYNRVHTDEHSAVRRVPTVIQRACLHLYGKDSDHIWTDSKPHRYRPHIVLGGRGWGAR